MIITKTAIPRRTVLRGIGATIALPLLDSMVPAMSAQATTAANPIHRFGVVYIPNGMIMQQYEPATVGTAFDLTPTLAPLEPYRDQLLVLSGLNNIPVPGEKDMHATASTKFLTGFPPRLKKPGGEVGESAGISMDQVLAQEIGLGTPLTSLELSLESYESAVPCEPGYGCAYTSTISWRNPSTPLPMEDNPRRVFERLFGDVGADPVARRKRITQQRSILDSVRESFDAFRRGLGPGDRRKIDDFLESVRDVERRIERAETKLATTMKNDTAGVPATGPAGVPESFEEHAKLMYDLQVLAYQGDLTRVITFMLGREFSNRPLPAIGLPEGWHTLSHHANDPAAIAKYARVNTYQTVLFGYYLEKLRATQDGDGSLLDHITLIYGAGMSDPNIHHPFDLPITLLGGGAGHLKGGRHMRYEGRETPLTNLHLAILDSFNVRIDHLGDSTGKIAPDPLSLG